MLKVVSIVDKKGTAIDRLAQGLKPYMTNIDYSVVNVHPKRPDASQIAAFEAEASAADIIQFDYFRTALRLMEEYPWLKDKKTILTHYNPYSIKESDWSQFDKVIACNESIAEELGVQHIPLAVDPFFWTYNREWKPNKTVIMVANRIEGKKGILEVATAAGNLGLKFVLVGAISDRNYFNDILQTGHVEFHEQISDEALRGLYHQSTIHVCNSIDNFESGTMPILEAMLCGVPVLTRSVGHVPDLYNGDNLTLLDSDPEDVEAIMAKMEEMLADPKKLETQRGSAWNTAKNFNPERRAYEYQKVYRGLFDGPSVSIITPIYDKPEVIRACLNAIAEQDYPNIELIVVDDNPVRRMKGFGEPSADANELLVQEFSKTVSFPVRYIYTAGLDYGLARARNEGVIAATGEIIVFCDQRMIMEPNAVSELVDNLGEFEWTFGNKNQKTDFVENFSAIRRKDIIRLGMFNERINKYGGLSQYARSMAKLGGIKPKYVESAKATPMGKSSNKNAKREEIIEMKNRLWKMNL